MLIVCPNSYLNMRRQLNKSLLVALRSPYTPFYRGALPRYNDRVALRDTRGYLYLLAYQDSPRLASLLCLLGLANLSPITPRTFLNLIVQTRGCSRSLAYQDSPCLASTLSQLAYANLSLPIPRTFPNIVVPNIQPYYRY